MSIGRILTPTLLLLLTTGTVSAEVYKWTDEDGVVHYGDRVPAKYAGTEKAVLNDQGVVIGKIDGIKSPERLAEEARLRAEEEAKRQRREQDRILLNTYLSVDEIEMLRDRRLDLLESQTRVTEAYISQLQDRLAKLENEARAYNYPVKEESDKPPLPMALGNEIQGTVASILEYEETLARHVAVQSRIRSKFEQDIERFRELKGL